MVRIADLESSNYWNYIGMRTVETAEGKIQVIIDVNDNLKQFYGNVHGGVIATLLDTSIAVAINQELGEGEGAATVEMRINYLRPVNTGRLRAQGKIIQKGRKIIVGQGEIKDDADNLIAFGTATFIVTQL